MNIIAGEKEKNYSLVKKFSEVTFWNSEYAAFLSDDFTLELPFAPPGWLQNMSPSESKTHLQWLERTVTNWAWSDIKVYATNYPDKFWILRSGEGDVFWMARDGRLNSRFITRVDVREGKISHMKDCFDNMRVYEAVGIALPEFYYTAPLADTMADRPKVPVLEGEALKKNTLAAVRSFVSVDFWEDDGTGQVYADNFVHQLPFTPRSMPRRYNLKEYDALNVWLQEHAKTWEVHPGTVLYETDSEGEYIIESGGCGKTTWSGIKNGFYQNRHVSYLKVENGYAVEFDEYFDPLKKFNSINQSIPSIPYLY
ncbi:MAG: phenazine biosynthesis protein [Lachnospiraceae bacterium]|nr:phenazine biosynthesis protein [Lachnospiraceae bacterium]